ncbi:MAG TPA: CbtB-domain containing protein [Xanthobacteraceae bacterium]|jgi:cobalt transporter subunit CbtB|nr:CbtB-domain containing protein [Xanthobacteraceae bacterium]
MIGKLTVDTLPQSASTRVAAALLLFFVGSLLIYGVGFANSQLLHNAAHDTRHSLSFPCH